PHDSLSLTDPTGLRPAPRAKPVGSPPHDSLSLTDPTGLRPAPRAKPVRSPPHESLSLIDPEPPPDPSAPAAAAAERDLPARPGEVFVNVDPTTDPSNQLPTDAGERVAELIRKSLEGTGYATSWPGGLPTSAELASNRSRAFILASTVKKI